MGYYPVKNDDYLAHHGILGMKWGIRRFQNKDGSLTALGKKRASEGAEGISKVLRKGQADARNVRIAGKAKGLAAEAALTIGSSAAGAALGSLAGPAAATGGMLGGAVGGSLAGKGARVAINQLSKEKAAALSQEYQLLGQKMMEEYGKTKVSDIDSTKSTSVPVEMAKEASNKYYEKGVYTNERNDGNGNRIIEPIDQKKASVILERDEYNRQTKAINTYQKSIKDKAAKAVKSGKFEMEFLERNLDVDEDGNKLSDKDMQEAYEKYLREDSDKYYK